jgi:uncharacterized membrane protein
MVTIKVKDALSKNEKQVKKLLKWFLRLNVLAIAVTTYLTYLHFKPSASTICKINEYFDCDIVNKSIYSELFGIPVSILGLLTYVLLFIVGWGLLKNKWKSKKTQRQLYWGIFGLTAFGTLFSGYLTYIELFVLQAVCIFCLSQQIIILINLGILYKTVRLVETDQ